MGDGGWVMMGDGEWFVKIMKWLNEEKVGDNF